MKAREKITMMISTNKIVKQHRPTTSKMNPKISKQPSEYLKSRNESTIENISSYKSHNIGEKNSRNVTSLKNYETNDAREKYRKDTKNSSFVVKPKPPQTTKAGNKPNIPKTFAYDAYAVSVLFK